MINVSNEYRNTITEERQFKLQAILTFPDGTIKDLTDSDIFQGGMSFDEATTNQNSFQIGYAYIGSHKLVIDNFDGKFDGYDFTGATVIPYVGLQLSETVEWLKKGVFTVDDPGTGGNIITLDCLDNMHKFERPFSEVEITFPVTAQFLLTTICYHCGVPLATTTFTNDDYVIKERPVDDAISCLDMVSYIGQITGNYAKCNIDGALEMKWYDTEAFEQTDNLDGGIFDNIDETTYQTGDTADGGNFTDYASGDDAEGGTFEQTKRYHHFYDFGNTPTICVDDVVITGVKVSYTEEDETYTALFGTGGYVLSIEENPLIQSREDADAVAQAVGTRIVGMRFRPFSANILSDPSVQAGDPCYVSVRTSRGYVTYQSYVTTLSYTVGQRMRISCDAETPSRNSSTRYSNETKAIVENRKKVEKKLTAYNIAVQQLTNLMANSFGVHKTEEKLENGSTIYYLHDKPTLAESQTIWKMTADAFAVSTDGGQTWNAGFDSNGNAVVNILNAIGVNAEWIKATGAIEGVEIITNRGKIAGLNITENGFASDNDIIAITNDYDKEGKPIQGLIKVRNSIPDVEKGVADSYTEVNGDGVRIVAGKSADPENHASDIASLDAVFGLEMKKNDEYGHEVESLTINPIAIQGDNPAKFFIIQPNGGSESIWFDGQDGMALVSNNAIDIIAPNVYISNASIDGRTMLDLERDINYNLAFIWNIVVALQSRGIIVDPPPQ